MRTEFKGYYYDGRTATRQDVRISVTPTGLTVSKDDNTSFTWAYNVMCLPEAFSNGQKIRLKVKTNPHKSIVLSNIEFLKTLKQMPTTSNGRFDSTPFERNSLLWGLCAGLVAVAVLTLIYFRGIPLFSNTLANHMPVALEERLGKNTSDQLLSHMEKCDEPDVDAAVEQIVARLNAAAPSHPYQFKVYVIKSTTVNALAAPGGQIILFSGLLEKTKSAEELAGVLAHEMQHIINRHATKGVIKDLSTSMLLKMLFGDVNKMGQAAVGGVSLIDRLQYSRTHEEEADRLGIDLLIKSRIDPKGMVRFFEMLSGNESKGTNIPRYLSTHPATSERIKSLTMRIGKEGKDSASTPLLPDISWKELAKRCSSQESRQNYEDAKGEEGWSDLHVAAAAGDISEIGKLLRQKIDVNTKNSLGRTPLYEAAKRGRQDAVKMLLDSGAEINVKDAEAGFTPLHVAAERKHLEVVKLLIERGAEVDARNNWDQTPLWQVSWNAWQKDVDVAKFLIEKRASVKIKDSKGYTPLHMAARSGYIDMAELLIVQGADINAETEEGITPLGVAANNGQYDTAFLLLRYDADVDKGAGGRSPLELALKKNNTKIASLLKTYGGKDLSKANEHLMKAVEHYKQGDFPDAINECSEAIAINPRNAEYYYYRGRTYEKIGDTAHAIEDLASAVQKKPDYEDALEALSWNFIKTGNHRENIDTLSRLIELKPNDGKAYFNRAGSYARLGEMGMAKQDVGKSCEYGYAKGCEMINRMNR